MLVQQLLLIFVSANLIYKSLFANISRVKVDQYLMSYCLIPSQLIQLPDTLVLEHDAKMKSQLLHNSTANAALIGKRGLGGLRAEGS